MLAALWQVPLEWIHTNTDRVSPRRQAKYRLQMALKLWIAQHITTDWYLTLDSGAHQSCKW
jgi:hypothetical protein